MFLDPLLWWNDQYLIKNAKVYFEKFPTKNVRSWFAGSNAQKNMPFISDLNQEIQSVAPKSLTWKYSDEPNENHGTIFQAKKEKALIGTLNQ